MKKSKRQILSLMAAAVMAAGLLSGCGGTEEAAETTAAAAETTAAAAEEGKAAAEGETEAAAEGTEDYSDVVITYGMTSAWDTVNPYGSSSGSIYQQLAVDKIYDRLAFLDEAGSDVTPRGAASWESADDGLSAIFHLDENAKWHDGEPVTAEDWVFTAQ